jgi:hypothetical protein
VTQAQEQESKVMELTKAEITVIEILREGIEKANKEAQFASSENDILLALETLADQRWNSTWHRTLKQHVFERLGIKL